MRISGFKNLVDVDVHFGPFTCIAGPNAVGKSNLFDAIRFLSVTASKTRMEAALSVRSQQAASADVRDLFHRVGSKVGSRMTFVAEMIAPKAAVDDLGQTAASTANLLRYTLELRLRDGTEMAMARGPFKIVKEELVPIRIKTAVKNLPFEHAPEWRKGALVVKRRAAPYISTENRGEQDRVIYLHQDGGSRGRAISNPATQPWTVLSVANAAESPTALCARREMDPKTTLLHALATARGKKGRHLKRFQRSRRALSVASMLDYSLLRGLSAFRRLEADVGQLVGTIG